VAISKPLRKSGTGSTEPEAQAVERGGGSVEARQFFPGCLCLPKPK
jgi:hypothetical protein